MFEKAGPIHRLVRTWLCFSLLAAVELGLFRVLLRFGLNLRLGLPGFVDYDLLLPLPLAILLFLFLADEQKRFQTRFSPSALWFNAAVCLLFSAWACLGVSSKQLCDNPYYHLVFWWMAVAVGLSAVQVNFPLAQLRRRGLGFPGFACLAGSLALVFVKNTYQGHWPIYSKASAGTACWGLSALSATTQCRWFTDGSLLISFEGITAFMGVACSGLDSLWILLCGSALFLFLYRRHVSAWDFAALFISGLLFSFALNQVRVLTIFLGAAALGSISQNPVLANQMMLSFFHTHAGWLLYAGGYCAFFWGWSSYVFRKLKSRVAGHEFPLCLPFPP